jgi:hypothetical protein
VSENKAQKIAVFIQLNSSDKTLILNGIKLAVMFKKELCLVYNYAPKEKSKHHEFKNTLENYLRPVKQEIPQLKTSVLVMSKNRTALPVTLADDYESIIIIADASQFKKYSKSITESPVPFLFVHPDSAISNFNKVVIPVDLRGQISDSAVWSSYFGRFNNAEFIAVAATEKGKDEQRQVTKNVVLTKKLYEKFNLKHKIYKGEKSSWRNAFEALDFAKSTGCNLFILLGSSAITPLDYLVGLPERKIIKLANNLPVLYINPRRDNYVLCD